LLGRTKDNEVSLHSTRCANAGRFQASVALDEAGSKKWNCNSAHYLQKVHAQSKEYKAKRSNKKNKKPVVNTRKIK
jgi:hypothetical protein